MKNGFLCALILLAVSYSQAEEPAIDSVKSKTAILLNIIDLNLDGYNGGLGIKYWIGKTYAVKLNADISYNDSRVNKRYKTDETYNLFQSVGFSLDIEKCLYAQKGISFYAGIGGGPSWSVIRYDYSSFSNYGQTNNGTRNYITTINANLILGAEYSLNKIFSLSFEQRITGAYSFTTYQEYQNEVGSEYEKESYSFDIGVSSLILLIYF